MSKTSNKKSAHNTREKVNRDLKQMREAREYDAPLLAVPVNPGPGVLESFVKQSQEHSAVVMAALSLPEGQTASLMCGAFPVKVTLNDAAYFARRAFQLVRNFVELKALGGDTFGFFSHKGSAHRDWLETQGCFHSCPRCT